MEITLESTPDWVISDTHLGHINIIRFYPWRQQFGTTIELHDERFIEEWNKIVKPSDLVLHNGDFALGHQKNNIPYFRARLNGHIAIALGNHDRTHNFMSHSGFDFVAHKIMFEHPTLGRVLARHDPRQFTLRDAKEFNVLLHGHWHGNAHHKAALDPLIAAKTIDCSMDRFQIFHPIPLSHIKEF